MTRTLNTDLFLLHLPVEVRENLSDVSGLASVLEEMIAAGRSAWPDILLAADSFFPFVASRLTASTDLLKSLSSLKAADLYLACACANQDPIALAIFQAECSPGIRAAIRRLDPGGRIIDDVEQLVFQRVLLGTGESQPKIVLYSGRGALCKWTQVVAVRVAQNLMRRNAREQPLTDNYLSHLISAGDNQEIEYLRQQYGSQFKVAFQQAIASLSSKQRNILRYRFLEEMSVEETAMVYRVHRMTMTRWLAQATDKLLVETQRSLSQQLGGANSKEVGSLIRTLKSQIDLSIRRFFQAGQQ